MRSDELQLLSCDAWSMLSPVRSRADGILDAPLGHGCVGVSLKGQPEGRLCLWLIEIPCQQQPLRSFSKRKSASGIFPKFPQ